MAKGPALPLPPQNLEAEEYVLGACMLSPRSIEAVTDIVTPDDFYRESHGRIFQAILDLYSQGKAVDAVTVADALAERAQLQELGGKDRIREIASIVPVASNAEHHARIVREMAIMRSLVLVGEDIARLGWERDAPGDELIGQAESLVFELSQTRRRGDFVTSNVAALEAFSRLEELAVHKGTVGLPTGFQAIDEMTSGLHPGNLVVIAGRPSMGKSLALDTPILTPVGWTTMGELQVGSEVIGGDGRADMVTAIFEQEERDLYRVTFADGASVECCDEHLWLTQTRLERRRGAPGLPRPLSEIRETLWRQDNPKAMNHTIPYVAPVHFHQPGPDLPLDPYWLGLYLGDGDSSGRVRLHTVDAELQHSFIDLLVEGDVGIVKEREGRCPAVEVRRVKRNNRKSESAQMLASLGLLGLGSHLKFVPSRYLYAEPAARLAVLQGLCDTDGYVTDPAGAGIEYTTVSWNLCEDVKFLARSLGGRATSVEKKTNGGDYYRVNLSFPSDGVMPVRLARKAERWNGRRERSRGRAIKRVDWSRRALSRCITVSRGLYVVNDFIVTHNTALALGMAAHAVLRLDPPVPVALFTFEMGRQEIIHRLYASEGLIPSDRLQTPSRLDSGEWSKIAHLTQRIVDAPFFIEDTGGGASMVEIRSKARRLKLRRPDLGLVIIDYLQLMSSGDRFESRQNEISQISRAMKVLAGELGLPVVALSQLSRDVEKRHDRRPILSDIRESGAVEQDADVVMFVYREEYYFPEDESVHGIAEVNIAKHRNGPTGMRKLSFVKRYSRFSNLDTTGFGESR